MGHFWLALCNEACSELTWQLLLGVIIVDAEYPLRPAFSLLAKVLDEFSTSVPQSSYGNPSSIQFPQLQTYLEKFQDPRQADAIMKVQAELDETKIILVRTTLDVGCIGIAPDLSISGTYSIRQLKVF